MYLTGTGFPQHPRGVEANRAAVQAVFRSNHCQRQHGRDIQQTAKGYRDAEHRATVGASQLGVLNTTATELHTHPISFISSKYTLVLFYASRLRCIRYVRLMAGLISPYHIYIVAVVMQVYVCIYMDFI